MNGLPTGSQVKLFTSVLPYYNSLLEDLGRSQHAVSMIYHAFVYGEWSQRIASVLISRTQAGVKTRLMTDGLGIFFEKPRCFLQNLSLIRILQRSGVRVDVFNPHRRHITSIHRLHMKLCAIDNEVAYVGGSNIADHYLTWDDTNLRLQSPLLNGFHEVYDEVLNLMSGRSSALDVSSGGALQHPVIRLTVPNRKKEIRAALFEIIEQADRAVYLRTWYFLPDRQVMQSLLEKARSGVEVHILLSHRTRVRPIDFMNRPMCRRLVRAGGRIYRYTEKYMHAKVAWNNKGDVLLGSANMDFTGMNTNVECSLALRDPCLRDQLQDTFVEDSGRCIWVHPRANSE